MALTEDIDRKTERMHEVFSAYLKGEVAVRRLANIYSEEDNTVYTPDYLLKKYLQPYIYSNIISKAELDLYNKNRYIDINLVNKRGKEIAQALINARFNFEDPLVVDLYQKYSDEDGKKVKYNKTKLKGYLNAFLNSSADPIKSEFMWFNDLRKKGFIKDNVLVDVIPELIKIKNTDLCKKYLLDLHIAKKDIKALNKLYKQMFRDNEGSQYIDDIISDAYKSNRDTNSKSIVKSSRVSELFLDEMVRRLQRLLDYYLCMSDDYERIDNYLPQYGFSKVLFNATIENAKGYKNNILRILIDKYYTKQSLIDHASYNAMRDIMEDLLVYGDMSLYDFYSLNTNHISIRDLRNVGKDSYTKQEMNIFNKFSQKVLNGPEFKSDEEIAYFIDNINIIYDCHELTDDEKDNIISVMKEDHARISEDVFRSYADAYFKGYLKLVIEDNVMTY